MGSKFRSSNCSVKYQTFFRRALNNPPTSHLFICNHLDFLDSKGDVVQNSEKQECYGKSTMVVNIHPPVTYDGKSEHTPTMMPRNWASSITLAKYQGCTKASLSGLPAATNEH